MQVESKSKNRNRLSAEDARGVNGFSKVTKGLVGRHKSFVREESLPWLPLLRRSIVTSSMMETKRKGDYNETKQQSNSGMVLIRRGV